MIFRQISRKLKTKKNQVLCVFFVMLIVIVLFIRNILLVYYDSKPPPLGNELNRFFTVLPAGIDENSTHNTNYRKYESVGNGRFKYFLNEVDLCRSRQNKDIVMLVAVYAGVRENVEREYVRSTWAAIAKINPKMRMIFILGLPEDPKLNLLIKNESDTYHDVIQANFTDTYRNLMFKSFALFHWVTQYCNNAKYVLKIDSDMYIDLKPLLNNLETLPVPSAFLCGAIWQYAYVFRNKDSKWYASNQEYPFHKYPRYCAGPAFIMPQRIVGKFTSLSIPRNPFPVDDVFITGILRTIVEEEAVGGLFSFSLHHESESDNHVILRNGNRIKNVKVL